MTTIPEERVLARVTRIVAVKPIAKADKIELVHVLGWHCCAKKAEFHVNDLCIYLAIDSVLEDNDDTAFLRPSMRLKTRRMCGVFSQGMVAPIEWVRRYGLDPASLVDGQDLTAVMRVKQHVSSADEAEARGLNADGTVRASKGGLLGVMIPKTRQSRLQDEPTLIGDVARRPIVIKLKEDGCSCTLSWINGKSLTFSRNVDVSDEPHDNLYHRAADLYDVHRKLEHYCGDRCLAIQAELVSPSINGGHTGVEGLEMKVFDVWDVTAQQYLLWDEVADLCRRLALSTVRLLYQGVGLPANITNRAQLQEMAEQQEYDKGVPAEGIVVTTDDRHETGRVSFKVISRSYLVKHDL